jgi:hypothetical protein
MSRHLLPYFREEHHTRKAHPSTEKEYKERNKPDAKRYFLARIMILEEGQ